MTIRKLALAPLALALVLGTGATGVSAVGDVRTATAEESADACVTVTHALGESCIPADPQRVVTLGCQTSLEYALALGLPIVGHDVVAWEPIIPPYIDPATLEGATPLGDCFAPSLELILPLEPDLIIYTFDAGNYPQVSAIAPTIVLSAGYASYRDDFLGAAALLGRTEQAEQILVDLDTRLAAAREVLAPIVAGKTVSAFQTAVDGKASIYGDGSYIGELITDLGLVLPPAQMGVSYLDVSLEQIGMLDGDIGLVVFGYTDPSFAERVEETKQQFVENPLWATLAFVANGAVNEMDKTVWGVHGILWADAMIVDIQTKLTD